jgi:hypothetical protein
MRRKENPKRHNPNKGGKGDKIEVTKKQFLDMSRKIAALESKQKEAITVDSDDETSQTGNRSSKALTKSSLRKKN